MRNSNFDIVMYTNAAGLGTECVNSAHRLPFIKGIAKAMEGIGKVLVILRYRSIPQCWFERDLSRGNKLTVKDGVNQLAENLWAIRPTVTGNTMLASYLPPVKWNLLRQLKERINHAARLLSMKERRIAWMTHPYHYLFRGCAAESTIVYECYDENVYDSSGKRSDRTESLEMELARNASLNIATAKPLFDKLSAISGKTILVSNGVMYDLFSQCRNSHMAVAPELNELPSPVIGMIGTLYRGYDFDLLNELIEQKKEWSFVFVGEIAENARGDVLSLSRHSNFHVFGWRPYEEVPRFLKGFDVAIIPYQVNDWTNTINPNKVYDYLAAGIPVVAAPIEELKRHREYISLCGGLNEFVEGIERALRGGSTERIQKGIQLAESLSWDSIASNIVNELKKLVWN